MSCGRRERLRAKGTFQRNADSLPSTVATWATWVMRQVHTFDRASQSQKLSRKICLPLHALPFATNEIVCGVINADTALVKVPSSHFARAKPVRSCLVFGNANRFCGTNILQRERRYCRQNCNGSRQLQATEITPPFSPRGLLPPAVVGYRGCRILSPVC